MLEFMALKLLRLPVIVYKSTPDSTNLGSLGCGMLTVDLPQQLLFVCPFFKLLCFSTTLLHFMWTRWANCGLAPIVLCCIGNHPDTVEVLGRNISEWCLRSIMFLDFSIYLFDLPLSICRTSIMVSFVNLISRYLVRTNLTSFKVVDQAGPWSVWSQLILVHFK